MFRTMMLSAFVGLSAAAASAAEAEPPVVLSPTVAAEDLRIEMLVERITKLEGQLGVLKDAVARLEDKTRDFIRATSEDGVPYLYFGFAQYVRVCINSVYWCAQKAGEGSAFVATSSMDWNAAYFQIEPRNGVAPTSRHRNTAVYAAVVNPYQPGEDQLNIAFEGHAANSGAGNLSFVGTYQRVGSDTFKGGGIRLSEIQDGSEQAPVTLRASSPPVMLWPRP